MSITTIDNLLELENSIQQAFAVREHTTAIFFDLKKAYDTTWRYGIIQQLTAWGIRVHMTKFITNSENGIPQGSVLAVTLFLIAINSIDPRVGVSIYADDISIFTTSKRDVDAKQTLQDAINNLSKWADQRGFKFSASKTEMLHFCRTHRTAPTHNWHSYSTLH